MYIQELSFNFSMKVSKEWFVIQGIENALMPGIMELVELCKKDFATMIIDAENIDTKNEEDTYQFILTIKKLSTEDSGS